MRACGCVRWPGTQFTGVSGKWECGRAGVLDSAAIPTGAPIPLASSTVVDKDLHVEINTFLTLLNTLLFHT